MALPPAGWYLDPEASTTLRWWSGERWTEHHQPRGLVAFVQSGALSTNVFAWVGLLVALISLIANPLGLVALLALVFASIGLARARRLKTAGLPLTGRAVAVAGLGIAAVSLLLAGTLFLTGRPLV